MASTSISPKYGDTETVTFSLASNSATGATYLVSGRALSAPYGVEVKRLLTKAGQTANDHIQLRVFKTEMNATTGKPATDQVLLDLSIAKDRSVLTTSGINILTNVIASILNNYGALAADTSATVTALSSGMDL